MDKFGSLERPTLKKSETTAEVFRRLSAPKGKLRSRRRVKEVAVVTSRPVTAPVLLSVPSKPKTFPAKTDARRAYSAYCETIKFEQADRRCCSNPSGDSKWAALARLRRVDLLFSAGLIREDVAKDIVQVIECDHSMSTTPENFDRESDVSANENLSEEVAMVMTIQAKVVM